MKYFKTVYRTEILSEERPALEAECVPQQAIDGEWSAVSEMVEVQELSAAEAAAALITQGSDPAFFRLVEELNDGAEEE